jgi:hypothetical protein
MMVAGTELCGMHAHVEMARDKEERRRLAQVRGWLGVRCHDGLEQCWRCTASVTLVIRVGRNLPTPSVSQSGLMHSMHSMENLQDRQLREEMEKRKLRLEEERRMLREREAREEREEREREEIRKGRDVQHFREKRERSREKGRSSGRSREYGDECYRSRPRDYGDRYRRDYGDRYRSGSRDYGHERDYESGSRDYPVHGRSRSRIDGPSRTFSRGEEREQDGDGGRKHVRKRSVKEKVPKEKSIKHVRKVDGGEAGSGREDGELEDSSEEDPYADQDNFR